MRTLYLDSSLVFAPFVYIIWIVGGEARDLASEHFIDLALCKIQKQLCLWEASSSSINAFA